MDETRTIKKTITIGLDIFFHGHYETGKICEYDIQKITGMNIPTELIEWLLKDRTYDFGDIFEMIEPNSYNHIVAMFCYDEGWYCEKIEEIFSIQPKWEEEEKERVNNAARII